MNTLHVQSLRTTTAVCGSSLVGSPVERKATAAVLRRYSLTKITRPPGNVSFHDAEVFVMEKPNARSDLPDGYEQKFRREVLGNVVHYMRERRWRVGSDPHVDREYRCCRKDNKRCVHPSRLQCKIRLSGRTLVLKFYQNVKRPLSCNPRGGEYDFNRLEGMPYLLRKRCEHEMTKLAVWLVRNCGYGYKPPEQKCHAGSGGVDVNTYLAIRAQEAHWHDYKRAIDDPKPIESYNSKCMDGHVKNGDRVYFLGGYVEQRWGMGIAEHNINNMWWVKIGTHGVYNIASHNIRHSVPEGGLRGRKIMTERRRERLEKLMLEAAKERRYTDAERMRVALEKGRYLPRRRKRGRHGNKKS